MPRTTEEFTERDREVLFHGSDNRYEIEHVLAALERTEMLELEPQVARYLGHPKNLVRMTAIKLLLFRWELLSYLPVAEEFARLGELESTRSEVLRTLRRLCVERGAAQAEVLSIAARVVQEESEWETFKEALSCLLIARPDVYSGPTTHSEVPRPLDFDQAWEVIRSPFPASSPAAQVDDAERPEYCRARINWPVLESLYGDTLPREALAQRVAASPRPVYDPRPSPEHVRQLVTDDDEARVVLLALGLDPERCSARLRSDLTWGLRGLCLAFSCRRDLPESLKVEYETSPTGLHARSTLEAYGTRFELEAHFEAEAGRLRTRFAFQDTEGERVEAQKGYELIVAPVGENSVVVLGRDPTGPAFTDKDRSLMGAVGELRELCGAPAGEADLEAALAELPPDDPWAPFVGRTLIYSRYPKREVHTLPEFFAELMEAGEDPRRDFARALLRLIPGQDFAEREF